MPTLNSKADTVFRSTSPVQTDLSQFLTNIAAVAGGAHESPSARTGISYVNREITVIFLGNNATTGTILYRGNTAHTVIGFEIEIIGTNLVFIDANGTVATVAMPGISASTDTFHAHICTRVNPLTTGASDTHTTEIFIDNISAVANTIVQTDHAFPAVVAGHNFSIGGRWNGAALTNTYPVPSETRIGVRFKSTSELNEDYGTPAAAPSTGENQATPFVAFDSAGGLGDGGAPAGPPYQLGGVQVRDCARRLMSPLLNAQAKNAIAQGRVDLVPTTANSRDVFDVVEATALNVPGHGNGPSGFPEISREFGTDLGLSGASVPVPFLTDLQTSDHTVTAWVRWDGSASEGVVAGISGGGSDAAHNDCAVLSVIGTGAVRLLWRHGAGIGVVLTSTNTLTSGVWALVGFRGVINGANLEVEFIVGTNLEVAVVGNTSPSGGTSSTFEIGRRAILGTESDFFDGGITELKYSSVAETNPNIAFEATRAQGYLLQQNELAHYQLRQPADGYWPQRVFLNVTLDDLSYKAHLDWLVRRPIHRMTGRFRAQVLLEIDSTGSADQVDIAVVATNRQPGTISLDPVPPDTFHRSVEASGAALEWVTFDDIRLPFDSEHQCWFYVATRIGDGSPTQTTSVRIIGVQLVPYSEEAEADFPLPIQEP